MAKIPQLTHAEIMSLQLLRFNGGEIVATADDLKTFTIVFVKDSVNEGFYNLLRASALMYQTLQRNIEAIEALEHLADVAGAHQLSPTLLNLASGIRLAQTVATEGIEHVADQMNAHMKEGK